MSADRPVRRLTTAAVLLVAAIAAVVSFVHIQHLAVTHGQSPLAAWLLPVSVDGTVAAASLSMLWAARAGLATPWLARGMLTAGVAATLAANAAYGSPHGLSGELLSGWPAVAFVGSVEMVLSMIRRTRATLPAPVPAAGAHRVPGIEPAPAPGGRVRRSAGAPGGRTRPPVTAADAAREFTADLAARRVPSQRAIRARLHVGQDRARQLHHRLAALAAAPTAGPADPTPALASEGSLS